MNSAPVRRFDLHGTEHKHFLGRYIKAACIQQLTLNYSFNEFYGLNSAPGLARPYHVTFQIGELRLLVGQCTE